MKKHLILLLAIIACSFPAFAQEMDEVTPKADETLGATPVVLTTVYGYLAPSGHTLVPARGIAEWFRAKMSYYAPTKTIYCESPDVNITLTVGNKTARVERLLGTELVTLAQPAIELDGYTMVPLRFIAEEFGYEVEYHEQYTMESEAGVIHQYRFPVATVQKADDIAAIPIYNDLSPADIAVIKNAFNFNNPASILIVPDGQVYKNYLIVLAYVLHEKDGSLYFFNMSLVHRISNGHWEHVISSDSAKIEFKGINEALKEQGLPRGFLDKSTDFMEFLLPYEAYGEGGDGFKIESRYKGAYVIHLTAKFNAGLNGSPIHEQLRNYYQGIAKAKQDALQWIREQEQNPYDMKIIWDYTKY